MANEKSVGSPPTIESNDGLSLRGELLSAKAFWQPFAAKDGRPATDNVRLVYEVYSEAIGVLEVSQLIRLPAPGFPAPVAGVRGKLEKGTFTHAKLRCPVVLRISDIDVYKEKVQLTFSDVKELAS